MYTFNNLSGNIFFTSIVNRTLFIRLFFYILIFVKRQYHCDPEHFFKKASAQDIGFFYENNTASLGAYICIVKKKN